MPEDLLNEDTALGMMRAEHQHIEELLNTCLTADQPDFLRQAMSVLLPALHVHFTLEREIFFPFITKLMPERDVLLGKAPVDEFRRLRQDNVTMMALAEQLQQMDPTNFSFKPTVSRLAGTFEHHSYLQEAYIYPLLEMSDDDTHNALIRLAFDLKRRKDAVLSGLSAGAKKQAATNQMQAQTNISAGPFGPDAASGEQSAHGT
jgi:hemerythrin superfamily protein